MKRFHKHFSALTNSGDSNSRRGETPNGLKEQTSLSFQILPVGAGTYQAFPFSLYLTHKSKSEAAVGKEDVGQFYRVEDMFDFDNVGFSRVAGDDRQYLVCADCEVGPIGYHDRQERKSYVALARVDHK